MTAKRIGCIPGAAFALILVGLAIVVSWTPPVHDVHTPGATPMASIDVDAVDPPQFTYGDPNPTTSLADFRCQVWKYRNSGSCPDPSTLEKRFWPAATQSPKTVYVGLPDSCVLVGSAGRLNVEYVGSSRWLIFHCLSARAWFVPPQREVGVVALPGIVLITVPTVALPAGSLTVVRDDRVEHLIGDDSIQVVLGRLTIS